MFSDMAKELISISDEKVELSVEVKTGVDNTHANGILQHSGFRIQVVVNNEPSGAVIRQFAMALNELLK